MPVVLQCDKYETYHTHRFLISISHVISNQNYSLYFPASLIPAQFTERLRSHEVKEGQSVRFTVRVAGKPAPEVTWYREGTQIVSSPDFELIQEGDVHTLYIPEVFYEDSGKFSVKAANKAATTDCTAELIVEGNYYI